MTPFCANYHYHPVMQFKTPKQPSSLHSEIQADPFPAGLVETLHTLHKNLQEVQANQTNYTGGKEVVFEVGDKVWLSTWHFRTTGPSKKLAYKRTGPCAVSKVVNKKTYELNLAYTIRNDHVFEVSSPGRYTPPTASQPPSEPQPTGGNNCEEWDVEWIFDSMRRYRDLHYLVQWAGYCYVRTSWEPAENLGNCKDLVGKFPREHPRKH